MSQADPPTPDQFEVSVIGPGRGECIVLHLGNNCWCVVDSCIAPGQSRPVAVEYLNSLGTNALAGVKLVVATHWHDDHVRGLASLLELVPNAFFYCTAAVNSREFFTLANAATGVFQRNSGVDEFSTILGLIEAGAPTSAGKRRASPRWAIQGRTLLELPEHERSFPVTITALSPSDGTVKLAFRGLARLLPKLGEPQRRVSTDSPNYASVVLWIQAGALTVLLGADLEHTGNRGEGWVAVLEGHREGEGKPLAKLFKIPHHGSANADHEQVWKDMLVANPIAVVTPYNAGAKALPQPGDLVRIGKRTSELYCTAAHAGKRPGRDAVVEKTMRRQLVDRRVIEGQPGQVRVRWSIGSGRTEPIVELFHGAFKVPGA